MKSPSLEALRTCLAAQEGTYATAGGEVAELLTTGGVSEDSADRLRDFVAAVLFESSGDRVSAERISRELVPAPAVRVSAPTLAELRADPAAMAIPHELVENIALEGRLTLFAAEEKAGKSTLWRAACASISTGRSFLGSSCSPRSVLWVLTEEHQSDVVRGFSAFGADLDRVRVGRPNPRDPIAWLEAAVAEYEPGVVVVDTLTKTFAGSMESFDSASEWAPRMQALRALSERSNASIVLLHHTAKSSGRYRNSTEIGAGVDVIVEAAIDPADDRARRLSYRGRYGSGLMTVRLTGNDYALVRGKPTVAERVLQFLRENPDSSQRTIRASVTGGNEEVRDAINELEREGRICDRGTKGASKYFAASSVPGWFTGPPEIPRRTAERTASRTACEDDGTETGPAPGGGRALRAPHQPPADPGFADLGHLFGEDLEYALAEREGLGAS